MDMSDLPVDPKEPMFMFFPETIMLQGLKEPVPIGTDALLQRVPSAHMKNMNILLKPYILANSRAAGAPEGINPWETYSEPRADGNSNIKKRNPDNYQYWMISYWRKYQDRELEQAIELADPSITPVMVLNRPHETAGGWTRRCAILSWLEVSLTLEPTVIAAKDIKNIEQARNSLLIFSHNDDTRFDFIRRNLDVFLDLKEISKLRALYVVGIFSILEGLLTTQKGTVGKKSITRQLQDKLAAVHERLAEPLNLQSYFENRSTPEFKEIIKILYNYRSDIAHGNISDLAKNIGISGSHDSIRVHRMVCDFLHALTRRLILHAIQYPEEMRSLKAS
ncbi:HEPN domain-containing protein [Verminephrobacter aporrectodeae]|uniref:HEPN domain-containing protein n=1 Tax=Verminephrobacter aporrectodeae TaxID=1110389 RepID=UPI00223777E6|nr:HEPN domain-containing protein [Verminephrobacter aporrectodeae]